MGDAEILIIWSATGAVQVHCYLPPRDGLPAGWGSWGDGDIGRAPRVTDPGRLWWAISGAIEAAQWIQQRGNKEGK